MKIGICGTGRMGSAIAQRLIAGGHDVAVWNFRDAARLRLWSMPAPVTQRRPQRWSMPVIPPLSCC